MAEHVVYNEDGVPVVIYASNAELEIIEEENIDGYPVQQNVEDGDTSEYQISIPQGYVKPEGTFVIDGSGTHDVTEYAAASVPAGSAAVPSTAITANPVLTIDDETGEISAVVSASQSIAPSVTEGWVESGTSGTVSVSGSASQQLTVRGDEDLGIGITDEITPGPIRPIKQTHVNVAAPPGYYPDGAYNFNAVDEATFDEPYDVTISPTTGAASIGFRPVTHGVVYENNAYTMTKDNVVTVEQGGTITPTTAEQVVMYTGPRYIVNPVKVGPIPSQYIIPTGTKQINSAGTFDVTEYAEAQVTMPSPSLQTKSATPTETAQTVTADQGYDGLGQVNVGAISSTYVGSEVPQLDGDDMTVSGPTVTAPAGYYRLNSSKTVASGTEGTPAATKGTVSNHQVSVTPSVTNAGGYIAGGTHTGTPVTVTAAELVGGAISINQNGQTDVTNYATANVNVPIESSWDDGTVTLSRVTASISGTTVTLS